MAIAMAKFNSNQMLPNSSEIKYAERHREMFVCVSNP